MAVKNGGNLAKNDYILFKDAPYFITKTEFMAPGKGSAIMRTKMRNIKTGAVTEFTFKSNEMVEVLNIDKREMQYLYHDSKEVVFMDPRTYDQVSVPATLVEDQLGYLIPDMLCYVSWYGDEAIGVILPVHVNLKVIETEDAIAGNRVNAPKKLAKLETGIEVNVPLFIKEGDIIVVDTSSGEYISRAS